MWGGDSRQHQAAPRVAARPSKCDRVRGIESAPEDRETPQRTTAGATPWCARTQKIMWHRNVRAPGQVREAVCGPVDGWFTAGRGHGADGRFHQQCGSGALPFKFKFVILAFSLLGELHLTSTGPQGRGAQLMCCTRNGRAIPYF